MWPDLQCPAVAQVSYIVSDTRKEWTADIVGIEAVRGYFDHATECLIARPVAAPPLPLHPDVRTQALQLIEMGAPPSEILLRNTELLEQLGGVSATDKYRVFLEHKVCHPAHFALADV
jgi:hypothetical protein